MALSLTMVMTEHNSLSYKTHTTKKGRTVTRTVRHMKQTPISSKKYL